ncbi:MAG: choice-of-anchor J domain-containing protein [Bacteroidetes bacterium]|nr:choice-of-anchor J domain-containing protein [Bacteroidota bacterium]
MNKLIYLALCFSVILFNSCKKKADVPPSRDLSQGTFYSVSQLRAIASCTNGCNNRITEEAYFKGVVIADEVSGNFYKEIYVRDAANSGGIHMTFTVSGSNLFIGDSVRLNLKGYDVNLSSGMVEIDSVNFEKNVVKFATGANPQPRVITLSDISTCSPYSNYLCDLITVTGVSFQSGSANMIWADPILQQSINRTLQDCVGNPLVVRTSNYALFAQQKTPSGAGSITGVATAFGTTNQLMIRTPNEVNMNGVAACNIYHQKNFNDNSITSGGWIQQVVTDPGVAWSTATVAATAGAYAKISGFYASANHPAENWLISPVINLSSASNPVLTFLTAAKFAGPALEVMVSTNYTSGAPNTASWTPITNFCLSSNVTSYVWSSSGGVSLNDFKNANTRIAFKYSSTATGATTYELDEIVIREN